MAIVHTKLRFHFQSGFPDSYVIPTPLTAVNSLKKPVKSQNNHTFLDSVTLIGHVTLYRTVGLNDWLNLLLGLSQVGSTCPVTNLTWKFFTPKLNWICLHSSLIYRVLCFCQILSKVAKTGGNPQQAANIRYDVDYFSRYYVLLIIQRKLYDYCFG